MGSSQSTVSWFCALAACTIVLGCQGFNAVDMAKLANPVGEAPVPTPTPIPIARTQTLSISDELDDGEIWGTDYHSNGENNASDLFAGYFAPDIVFVFHRFQLAQAIPAGSEVTDVRLSLHGSGVNMWNSSTMALQIGIDDAADVARVADANDLPGGSNGRLSLATTVRWPETGGLVWNNGINQTPNLKVLLQQLVDKYGGLQAGASIQFWVYAPSGLTGGADAELIMDDFGHPDHATSLVVDWTK